MDFLPEMMDFILTDDLKDRWHTRHERRAARPEVLQAPHMSQHGERTSQSPKM